MNPPFSNGDRHILHALNFVRGEGKLVCLLNAETLKNPFTNTRQELSRRLSELGADIRFLESGFCNAERATNVEIAIVTIAMPEDDTESVILDTLRPAQENRTPYADPGNPLVSSDRICAMVEHFDNEAEAGIRLINEFHSVSWFMLKGAQDNKAILELSIDGKSTDQKDHSRTIHNNFLMQLRYRYWKTLFTVPEFTAKLTSKVQSDLSSRVAEFAHYDFNLYNIYQLYLDISKELFTNIKKAIFDLFEDFTHRYHYDDYSKNVHFYNGWKTNKAFKVNRKVIIPLYLSSFYWNWGGKGQYSLPWEFKTKICDIEKVFDFLAGSSTASHNELMSTLETASRQGQTRKIETKYFFISIFKKGTCHIEFNDPRLIKKFNIYGSREKGWLPPGYGETDYDDLDAEAKTVVDSFEGRESYEETVHKSEFYLLANNTAPLLTLCG